MPLSQLCPILLLSPATALVPQSNPLETSCMQVLASKRLLSGEPGKSALFLPFTVLSSHAFHPFLYENLSSGSSAIIPSC